MGPRQASQNDPHTSQHRPGRVQKSVVGWEPSVLHPAILACYAYYFATRAPFWEFDSSFWPSDPYNNIRLSFSRLTASPTKCFHFVLNVLPPSIPDSSHFPPCSHHIELQTTVPSCSPGQTGLVKCPWNPQTPTPSLTIASRNPSAFSMHLKQFSTRIRGDVTIVPSPRPSPSPGPPSPVPRDPSASP